MRRKTRKRQAHPAHIALEDARFAQRKVPAKRGRGPYVRRPKHRATGHGLLDTTGEV